MNKPILEEAARPAITLKALKAAFADRLGREGPERLNAAETAFVAQVHAHCTADELAEMAMPDLVCLLEQFWRFAERRPSGEARVRLAPAKGEGGRPLGRDVLEAVMTDSPFIVDSVMGELVAAGATILAMFHPVVEVARDGRGRRTGEGEARRESMLHVLIEPLGEARRAEVLAGVEAALADLKLAVEDFPEMVGLMGKTIAELEAAAVDGEARQEALAFLRWLEAERFVFLGARIYDYPAAKGRRMPVESSLGVLRDPDRVVLRDSSDPALRSDPLKGPYADQPLVVAKANMRSRVHRRAYMDYVGVKRYGEDGKPCGEVRFVGLFTSEAYDQPVTAVPLIRRKMARVLSRARADVDSHNGRRLRNILETYPRDELFQASEDEVLSISQKIMHLYDRPRLRLFARVDPFDRFISVLLYVPRSRYNEALAERAGAILARAWGGRVSALYPSFSDAPLAQVHYIIGVDPGRHDRPDLKRLEAEVLEASRTWEDRFDAAIRTAPQAGQAADLAVRYRNAFPIGYRDLFDAAEAMADIAVLEALDQETPIGVRAYRRAEDGPAGLRLKLYRRGQAAPLSDITPILERMGLRALAEHGFPVAPAGGTMRWVHEIQLEAPGPELDFDEVKGAFEEAFVAIWNGWTENDGFNRLVLALGIGWREAALVRALARYRQQSGLDPSQAVQEAALAEHPGVARLILDLFRIRFDTALNVRAQARAEQAAAVFEEIVRALQAVDSLDADRVLRRLAQLVRAIRRTNYYQLDDEGRPKSHISFKVASQELDDLPAPKPYREIFVWSPRVEGVHLRFGPVARGGLRWSDRRDDFRTEVLGLAKAQQVKNAVIVPVGAKGGFYPKCLPRGGTPEQVRAEGVAAYITFLNGLLDITDNLDPAGKVIPPEGVVREGVDDPYLVVAADKGTATFSDIANGVAAARGFWLGDAFASGGSAGYDHKAMGITARGAWEAVKRHFREIGKDIQAQPFTVIGVGDMSGDVFGNGMLLSRQTRLLAAFDHRHVFIDPDPDPEVSFKERERLFALPRSSWADYDPALISRGGGVYPRNAKSVELSPEARALLGVDGAAPTPDELIRSVLKAEAELLYLGGVGAYVKAPGESHADVGDKANDAVRVDASDLRVAVVGEGANLGVTQAGRIAYAKAGGRIDTDAIDNSAGVDTSDHEVNIKILVGGAVQAGRLTLKARDKLLKGMTEEVAAHVLRHNYDQTLALSLMQATAPLELESQGQFIADLVAAGRLDRRVEGLPGPAALADLALAGEGLTRPELAVVLAYGKLELSREIVESPAPDDPYFGAVLRGYFPAALARFDEEMQAHPLRREIIATVLANDVVNRVGPTFAPRLRAAAECDTRAVVVAFEAARRLFGIEALWRRIGALDNQVPAAAQTQLYLEVSIILRRQVYWLARRVVGGDVGVDQLVTAYQPAADALRKEGLELFSPFERARVEKQVEAAVAGGAPRDLASDIAALTPLTATTDVADMARAAGWPTLAAGRLYHAVGAAFGFDRLRAAAGMLGRGDAFERRAVRRLIEDLLTQQAAVAASVMAEAGKPDPEAVEAWTAPRRTAAEAAWRTLEEVEAAKGGWSFAKLTIAAAALRELSIVA